METGNFWKDFHWYPCGRTFLIKAREKVSQETIPWSMSSTKAVSVKESRSPKLKKTRQQPLATSLLLTCTETAKPQLYRARVSEWCSWRTGGHGVSPADVPVLQKSSECQRVWQQRNNTGRNDQWYHAAVCLGQYSYDDWTYNQIH